MSPSVQFIMQLADPRGRYDRTDFIWAAITLIFAQAAFALGLWLTSQSFMGWRGFVANVVFVWLGFSAISKRLHDLGHSTWWVLGCAAGWLAGAAVLALAIAVIAGPHALEAGTAGFWATFTTLMLPPAVLAAWLHLARGEPIANRYGPTPAHG